MTDILVHGIFGYKTRQPRVAISIDGIEVLQLGTDEARKIAADIVTAAEAAEQDGFIISWATDSIGASYETAQLILLQFRQHRQSKQ